MNAGHVEKTTHPCQFPVALAQRLIRALCPPQGHVVDPFMGSGTVGIAAVLESKNFSGCDKKRRYVRLAEMRLKKLTAGDLRYRPLDRPIYVPRATDAVAKRPPHFPQSTQAY